MTVEELIAELQKIENKKAKVFYEDYENGFQSISGVSLKPVDKVYRPYEAREDETYVFLEN